MDLPYQSEVIRLVFYPVVWLAADGEIYCHVFHDRKLAVVAFYNAVKKVTDKNPENYGKKIDDIETMNKATEETTAWGSPVKFYGHYHSLRITVEDN